MPFCKKSETALQTPVNRVLLFVNIPDFYPWRFFLTSLSVFICVIPRRNSWKDVLSATFTGRPYAMAKSVIKNLLQMTHKEAILHTLLALPFNLLRIRN